jgi:ribonuclease HI
MRRFVVCALCCLLSLSAVWSQQASPSGDGGLSSLPPFDAALVYEVSGVTLNAWLTESKMQQAALQEALTKLSALEASLANAESLSNEALKAVNASLTSFEAYRRNVDLELWLTRGGAALLVAYELWRNLK